ncbi:MAG TPA: FlgD immunoglobulin-like domain containing protein [Planctomycetota bacterium]|nr:FlgD immunoglobulin-like domain containing protein [Planctomycetota bacterium]
MRNQLLLAVLAAWAGLAAAQPQRHDKVVIVPVPGTVAVDGDLKEWDLSGSIECAFDESLRPKFTATLAFMFDREALYIAARVADDTPLVNRHDPKVEPNKGWDGDALQVRLCSDPKAAYPLRDSNSDRICHLTLWHYTDRQEPVLQLQYGMDYHGTKLLVGAEAGVAFRKDADGKGYALEARVPWKLLNAADGPPKAEDKVALVVQPLWGDGTGWKQVCSFNDVIREVGFSFQGAAMWGQAVFSPRGNLPKAERPVTVQEALTPLTVALPVADAQAKSVSAAICDATGRLVRTLPVSSGAPRELKWDGLDDDGRPLPAGDYTLKVLSHRGIGQRWVTSLHNAGNPPWRTDDGTGSWGGDHGPPIAAACDAERVYLGWTISEAGWAVVALKKDFTPDGKVQKLWGQHQVLDLGILVTGMATDGERLFVAQDGQKWGETNPSSFTAGIVLWEAKSGRPVNFPFGKRTLVVSQWKAELKRERKPFWENVRSGDVGPQDLGLNLAGIAVAGDVLYASLYLENKVVAFDWRTGRRLKEYAVPSPVGLAVAQDGKVLAASEKRIVELDPASDQSAAFVSEGLSAPWAMAVDGEGRIYVTDCGTAMQVKVFDAAGKPLGAIGKAGGRPWVGRYDPAGMLMPAGITVDASGKVWATEYDSTPKRVSVWSRDGKLLADLLGGGAYAIEGIADEQKPSWVNAHDTLFEVDYATGRHRTVATLTRPNLNGLQFDHDGGYMGRALKFRHLRGRTYVVHTGRGGVVVYRLRDDLVAEPLAAIIDGGHLKFHLPDWFLKKLDLSGTKTLWWLDRNGDTFIQEDELLIQPVATALRNYWGPWVDDDLSFWNNWGNEVFHVSPTDWLPSGAPVYPKPVEQKPLFKALGDQVHYVMPDGDSVYLLEQSGGNVQTGKGTRWSAISRYTLDGKRQWAYRNVWLGFGLEAPLARPGDVVGAMKFIGKVKLSDRLGLIGVNGYFGQFNLLSSDGLWVASLCKDNRYGPKADSTTVWPENFSGWFYRNHDDGKVYLIAGDTDARIWEVTGLDTIRTAEARLALSEGDHGKAVEVASRQQGAATTIAPIRLLHMPNEMRYDDPAVPSIYHQGSTLDAGAGRAAKVLLGYNDKYLTVDFDVQDESPMRNSGKDFALLFKTGDACDVMLACDPEADAKRTQPARGDVRLLFSVLDDKPVCVLYEAEVRGGEKRPKTFSSPTGSLAFERVMMLDSAQVVVQRTAKGYRLSAAVPLREIGFAPKPGLATRGDVGVIFSDPGGSRNVLRAYHANKDTAIVNDIPSEARLAPDKWGILRVE